MFQEDGGRPGDRRGFLHKSFIGRAVGGIVKRGFEATPLGQGIATVRGIFKPPARAVAPRTTTARPSLSGAQGKETGRQLKFGTDLSTTLPAPIGFTAPARLRRRGFRGLVDESQSPCRAGESARCCELRNGDFTAQRQWQRECGTAGNGAAATGVGAAVMGRYGAALEPGIMIVERSVCLPGMNLGDDGLCYNKGAITNSQRQWPRGRRPLLTGGDMRAIGIAARAGSKLDRTTKRLRALGMMKALPKGRATAAHAHAKPVAAVSVQP